MVKISVIGICGKSTFMNVDHFHEKGETLIANGLFEEIGGKGINQAIAAARMGASVSFLAAVGDDANGDECETVAAENGIRSFIVHKEKKNTAVAFILTDKNGENQVTEYKSAELNKADVLSFEAEIASSDILLLQQEVPSEVNEVAVRLARKHNVRVILNPAPIREIPDEIAEYVYAVTPNEQEKQAIKTERFKNCITTLGSRGCMINKGIIIPPLNVKVVDTTGAGDTFNGVLAVCIAEGMSLEFACKYAVTASGISVSKKFVINAIPTRAEVERKVKK